MNQNSFLPRIVLIIVALIIFGYVAFRFAPLLIGPSVLIRSPATNTVVESDYVDLVILTSRVTELYIDEFQIDIDKSQETTHRKYLNKGINRIEVLVYDTYGKEKKRLVSVIKK